MKFYYPAKFLSCIAAAAVLALGSTASAALFYSETFTYDDGNLVGNGPDAPSPPLWAAHSGAGSNPVQVSSGTAVLVQGSGSREDVNLSTGTTLGQGETWYAGFDLTVNNVTVTGTTEDYFASFLQGTGNFTSRLWVAAPTGDDGYRLGITGSTGTSTKWSGDLTEGQTYRIVLSYTLDPDNNSGTQDSFSKLWVNPASESSTSVSHVANHSNAVTAFAFRQGSTGSIGTQVIDNLSVATTFQEALTGVPVPEPASVTLLALVGLAVFGVRRRNGR